MNFRLLIMLFFVSLLLTTQAYPKGKVETPYVVVLSMDAFRWDYPQKYSTPWLDSIAKVGVKAAYLQPCFPSKTFPNHYSMATGLYPDNHGIVQNSFVDEQLGSYSLGNRKAVQNAAFYGGEPLWVSAEKQNVRSACFFWPGSEAPIKGVYPSIWKKYDGSIPFAARADSVVSWLQKPSKERPRLIFWYMSEPDGTGHKHGPNSEECERTVVLLDSLVGDFYQKVQEQPHADSINLIFTADHGMGTISADKAIQLKKYIPDNWVKDVKGANPVYLIEPSSPVYVDSIRSVLTNLKGINCWKKENMPAHLHYGTNKRIYDLVCVAQAGWSIYWDKMYLKDGGTHGYDPECKDMHAIFYATGPQFKSAYKHPGFENIHLYVLLSKILGLTPAKTDGNINAVKGMLNGR